MSLVRRMACVLGGGAVLAAAMAVSADAAPRDRTTVILQVDVPGRANANRHRLAVMARGADGRDAMLALSCRVAEPSVFGVAIELGGEAPPMEGRNVTFRLENPDGALKEQLASTDKYLILGGDRAVRLFTRALRSEVIDLDDGAGRTASFRLSADRARIDRFRELCQLD